MEPLDQPNPPRHPTLVPVQHLADPGLRHSHRHHLAQYQRLFEHAHRMGCPVQCQHCRPLPLLVHIQRGHPQRRPSHLLGRPMPLEAVDQLQTALSIDHHQRRQLPVRRQACFHLLDLPWHQTSHASVARPDLRDLAHLAPYRLHVQSPDWSSRPAPCASHPPDGHMARQPGAAPRKGGAPRDPPRPCGTPARTTAEVATALRHRQCFWRLFLVLILALLATLKGSYRRVLPYHRA